MGLLDSLAGQVLNSLNTAQGGSHGGLLDAVTTLLNDPQHGGLSGLVSAFEQQGLGGIVASWIGTGQNQAISGDQLQAVLGSDKVSAIAQQLGFSPEDASAHLAQLLPQVVDKLTPNGQLPGNDALGGLLGLLKNPLG